MITASESASLLLATIRPNIVIPDHVAEADVLMAIVKHLECDRHHLTLAVAQGATGLLPMDEDQE